MAAAQRIAQALLSGPAASSTNHSRKAPASSTKLSCGWKSHSFVHSELRARAAPAESSSRPAAPCQAVLVQPPPKDGSKDKKGKEAAAVTEDRDAVEVRMQRELYNAAAADPAKPPFELLESYSLADGVLDIVRWEGDRMLRIWKPAGYNPADEPSRYPVMYLNDGQNLFNDGLSMSGSSWRAAETAASLIASGRVPPFVIVGIDNACALRSWEYTPYKPGTGPTGVRKDAASWPGGGVNDFLDRVVNEVLPWTAQAYHVSSEAAKMGFGGSSFGGICTLAMAMKYPKVFGAMLVESPSLWLANERFLKEDIAGYAGEWPQRTFLAMGSQEYTFTRPNDPQPDFDRLLTTYIPEVAKYLEANGVKGEDRVRCVVEGGGGHTESAWARRLPEALEFLAGPWWHAVAAGRDERLLFTSPRRPCAGKPAALFFNRARSDQLRGSSGVPLVNVGFNEWRAEGTQDVRMQPAPWLGLQGDWWVAPFKVPATAYEMNFAFSNGTDAWDNNGGNNFYQRVRALNLAALGDAGPQLPLDKLAQCNGDNLYFTYPSHLVAGGPVQMYCNKAKSGVLNHSPNVNVHYGFNDWSEGVGWTHLKPTSLWKGEGVDWWATDAFEVPEGSFEMNFAFNDGSEGWENNAGGNFRVSVKDVKKLEGKAPPKTRVIESRESHPHAWGELHVLTLAKKEGKHSKWTEEKRIRVWTPPGYNKENPPPGGWPVLYLNDGQNMFEDWLAHQGVSWRAADKASDLIRSGQLPPFLICAIDNAGPMRSLNFLPYVPGTGVGGFRGDCERWPGGGVGAYLNRLVDEILPLVQQEFGATSDPFKTAFGGGSFAGVAALYASMHFSHVFGSVLCESPSLWVTEGKFLGDLAKHEGMLPERIFIGCGTREYSATRDHDRDDVDALLLHYYSEAARILHEKGMRGSRMRFLVEEGAGHHELAWQWRLTGALQFLLSPWWE